VLGFTMFFCAVILVLWPESRIWNVNLKWHHSFYFYFFYIDFLFRFYFIKD
jgi:hypothetical protein